MKPRIKSMIWNIRKLKTINQINKKKKESKIYENNVSSLWDNFMHSNICMNGGARRRREGARNWKSI